MRESRSWGAHTVLAPFFSAALVGAFFSGACGRDSSTPGSAGTSGSSGSGGNSTGGTHSVGGTGSSFGGSAMMAGSAGAPQAGESAGGGAGIGEGGRGLAAGGAADHGAGSGGSAGSPGFSCVRNPESDLVCGLKGLPPHAYTQCTQVPEGCVLYTAPDAVCCP